MGKGTAFGTISIMQNEPILIDSKGHMTGVADPIDNKNASVSLTHNIYLGGKYPGTESCKNGG